MKANRHNIQSQDYVPLARRVRPQTLDQFVGQTHLLAKGKPLYRAISEGLLHSMIFWGPPGTGKTTLANLIAHNASACFKSLSAIYSGVKDIRKAVDEAKQLKVTENKKTILFIDEVHRFNKAQQDVFLPYIEDGTFIFIGATTENPSFELNSALLSRARVYVLKSLTQKDLLALLQSVLNDAEFGLGGMTLHFPEELQSVLVQAADGDARQLLNMLEIITDLADDNQQGFEITRELLTEVLQMNLRRFDKQGEAFYDQISALHKSVRGSSPDAALYWLCRMLDGGCDPRYIARRVLRMANEDIGIADPRAQEMALNACDVYERLGSPEGELAIAQAVIYLSCAAKSNAVYLAYKAAMQDAKQKGSLEVPLHLRNAPTKLMKDLDYGKAYRYAHDEKDAYAAGENYFPESMKSRKYYHPVARGLEAKVLERLNYFTQLDKKKQD